MATTILQLLKTMKCMQVSTLSFKGEEGEAMKNRIKYISSIAMLVALSGCSDLLQSKSKKTVSAKVLTIASDACKTDVGNDENAQGMIQVELYQDYLNGNVMITRKSFIAGDKIGLNPYTV